MAKVKFKMNTLDKDTGVLYPMSDEFVDVSDAFAERLKGKEHFEFEQPKAKVKEEVKDK